MAGTKHVQATCNPRAGVWWAESEDLPGLVSEVPTLDALVDRVMAADGLLAANGTAPAGVSLQLHCQPSRKRKAFRRADGQCRAQAGQVV